MGAAAPARKAPARKAVPTRKGSSGRNSHSARRQKPKRSPRAAGGVRHGVRATPARPKRRTAQTARRGVRASARPARSTSGAAHLVPVAVGRTAVAMRGLPDSGLVLRLTRGRAWIGLLSVLLTGIVALNVVSLSLSATQGKLSEQAQILEQENSALRARLAERLSSARVRNAAASLGMAAPDSTDINYRDASKDAVRLAAQRLANWYVTPTSLISSATTAPVAGVAPG
jgi:hypothetical protein